MYLTVNNCKNNSTCRLYSNFDTYITTGIQSRCGKHLLKNRVTYGPKQCFSI